MKDSQNTTTVRRINSQHSGLCR